MDIPSEQGNKSFKLTFSWRHLYSPPQGYIVLIYLFCRAVVRNFQRTEASLRRVENIQSPFNPHSYLKMSIVRLHKDLSNFCNIRLQLFAVAICSDLLSHFKSVLTKIFEE